MIRHLAVSLGALFAGAAQAQQWVELSDPLAFEKLPPIWCNAERSACILSRQAYGATGAVRVALTVASTPDCRQRRARYVYTRRNGETGGDLSRVQEVMGNTWSCSAPGAGA